MLKLAGKAVSSIFVDTAPFIYFIEAHPTYRNALGKVFREDASVLLLTSVITVTEVLPKPVRDGHPEIVDAFLALLSGHEQVRVLDIDFTISERAGRLRGKYAFLRTMDALQIAAALFADSTVFLTNDANLKRIREIEVVLVSDL